MEYKGSHLSRKVDFKRRFMLPAKWVEDDVVEYCFVTSPITQNNEIRLYTAEKWKNVLEAKQSDDAKGDFAKRTTHVRIDKQRRLLLPKEYVWKKVDLIGVLDFIIIIESVV